jgi:hypothetical protein
MNELIMPTYEVCFMFIIYYILLMREEFIHLEKIAVAYEEERRVRI